MIYHLWVDFEGAFFLISPCHDGKEADVVSEFVEKLDVMGSKLPPEKVRAPAAEIAAGCVDERMFHCVEQLLLDKSPPVVRAAFHVVQLVVQ